MKNPKSGTTNDLERHKLTITTLIDFSKHLMMILVASIAFSASMASTTNSDFAKYAFIASVISAILSLIMGHEGYILKVDSLLKTDKEYELLNENDVINTALVKKIKGRIEVQYLFTLISLILISVSIILTTID